jgi:hypothetical protein
MATRQEAAEALRATVRRAEEIAARLTEADLGRTVHEGGWNVKQVFAHLASLGAGPAFFIQMAQQPAGGGGGVGEGFDIDGFNKQQVETRQDKSMAELLAEYRQGRERGIQVMESTSDEVLAKEIWNFQEGTSPVLEVIQRGAAEHDMGHLDEVESALRG